MTTTERIAEIPWLLAELPAAAAAPDVVDIGCRHADYLPFIRQGRRIVGIDPNGSEAEGLTVVQQRLDQLDGEWRQAFDVALCISTLDHIGLDAYGVPADESLLAAAPGQIRRLLRPGGLLLVTVPVGRSQVTTHPEGGQRMFDRDELLQLLAPDFRLVSEAYARLVGDDYDWCTWQDCRAADYAEWRAGAVGMYVMRCESL